MRIGSGDFVFLAAVQASEPTDVDKFPIVAKASSTQIDTTGHHILPEAIASMQQQGVKPLVVGPTHEAVFIDASSIIGWVAAQISDDTSSLLLAGHLNPDDPRSPGIYWNIRNHPDEYKLSIGGRVPKEARHSSFDPETGQAVLGLSDFFLNHHLLCRADSAIQQDTGVAASSDWRDVVFKAAVDMGDETEEVEAAVDTDDVAADTEEIIGLAVWDTAYQNDLPDSAFLWIESGGTKDKSGKTVPRKLRHLPVRDKDGKVDAAHARNAIARAPLLKTSDGKQISDAKAEALQNKARALLKAATDTEGKAFGGMSADEVTRALEDELSNSPGVQPDRYIYVHTLYDGAAVATINNPGAPSQDLGVLWSLTPAGKVQITEKKPVRKAFVDEAGKVFAPPSEPSGDGQTMGKAGEEGMATSDAGALTPSRWRGVKTFLDALLGSEAPDAEPRAATVTVVAPTEGKAEEPVAVPVVEPVQPDKMDTVLSALASLTEQVGKLAEAVVGKAEEPKVEPDAVPAAGDLSEAEDDPLAIFKAGFDKLQSDVAALKSARGISAQPPLREDAPPVGVGTNDDDGLGALLGGMIQSAVR